MVDFGALAGATNFANMLAHGGCTHTKGIQKEILGEPSVLGSTSDSLLKSIHNFMSSFWVFFSQQWPSNWRIAVRRFVLCYLSFFLVESFGFGFFRYPTNLSMVVYFCDLQELQKEAAKGAARSQTS
jgi:hypothetical protein